MSRAQGLEIELANRLTAALTQINQLIAQGSTEDRGTDREVGLHAAAGEIAFALNRLVADEAFVDDRSQRKNAAAIMADEQRLASGLIEAMPGIFYLYDEHGRFLRWNSNFERVSGYSAQEIAAMHPLDFFAAGEKELLEQRIGEVFTEGEATVEASLLSKQGNVTPYFFTGKRIELDGSLRLVGRCAQKNRRALPLDARYDPRRMSADRLRLALFVPQSSGVPPEPQTERGALGAHDAGIMARHRSQQRICDATPVHGATRRRQCRDRIRVCRRP